MVQLLRRAFSRLNLTTARRQQVVVENRQARAERFRNEHGKDLTLLLRDESMSWPTRHEVQSRQITYREHKRIGRNR